jgi:hypothetical protein
MEYAERRLNDFNVQGHPGLPDHSPPARHPKLVASLGFGRIVASEIGAPNMLAKMV